MSVRKDSPLKLLEQHVDSNYFYTWAISFEFNYDSRLGLNFFTSTLVHKEVDFPKVTLSEKS